MDSAIPENQLSSCLAGERILMNVLTCAYCRARGGGFKAQSSSNDKCNRGKKAFCCKAGDWKAVIDGCYWTKWYVSFGILIDSKLTPVCYSGQECPSSGRKSLISSHDGCSWFNPRSKSPISLHQNKLLTPLQNITAVHSTHLWRTASGEAVLWTVLMRSASVAKCLLRIL